MKEAKHNYNMFQIQFQISNRKYCIFIDRDLDLVNSGEFAQCMSTYVEIHLNLGGNH